MLSSGIKNVNTGNEENSHDESIPAILHLVYKKVPMTMEMRRRQYEEQLRKKHSITTEKTGRLR